MVTAPEVITEVDFAQSISHASLTSIIGPTNYAGRKVTAKEGTHLWR